MALNWDKLEKFQKDYPKPKFASNEIARQLKKRPNDPYLLAWQVDNGFKLGNAKSVADTLDKLCGRQPPITDPRLLSYLYCLQIQKIHLLEDGTQAPVSAGKAALAAWENAAKGFQSKSTRLSVWNELFATAMQEECWEDVRLSVVQAQKEGLKTSKNAVFAGVLAGQLSYESQKQIADSSQQTLSPQTSLQKDLALARMKIAFQISDKFPDDPTRVKDFADLLFMKDIYFRQSKSRDMFELWEKAPAPLKNLLDVKGHDILLLKLQVFKTEEQWSALRELCVSTAERAIEESEKTQSLKPLQDLSENVFDLWQSLFLAIEQEKPSKQANAHEKAKEIIECFIDKAKDAGGRNNELTLLYLRKFCGEPLLPLCKTYWNKHRRLPTCLKDLAPFVKQLTAEERKEFYKFTQSKSVNRPSSPNKLKDWLRDEFSVRDIGLLLASLQNGAEAVDDSISSILDLCKTALGNDNDIYYRAGYLALYYLSNKTRELATSGKNNLDDTRRAYQAELLSQHLQYGKDWKDNRVLVLYTAHLNILLGLGTIAFQQYPHVKVKEMLNETVSHYLLSDISRIHPFDTTGLTKFSPDQELAAAVGKLEKMEGVIEGTLLTDIQDFKYGQALDLLGLKRGFRSSLAKHLCMVDRRRIARLKGGVVDENLDLHLDNFVGVVDNRQSPAVFTPGGHEATSGSESTVSDVYQYYKDQDIASQLILKEIVSTVSTKRLALLRDAASNANIDHNSTNEPYAPLWTTLAKIAHQLHIPEPSSENRNPANLPQTLTELLTQLSRVSELLSSAPQPNKGQPTDSIIPNSAHLIRWYSILEILQVTTKALDTVDEQLKKSKTIPAKGKTEAAATSKKVRTAATEAYKLVRKQVQDWAGFLNSQGVAVLKSWARSGITGKALMETVGEDNVEYYAKRAVDSLVETLAGVLKVKVGK